MKHLLDVNVILACLINTHPHNLKALAWIDHKQITLCPLGTLGFLRISSSKKQYGLPMAEVRKSLQRFIEERNAELIADDLPALKSHPKTSDQVTDHYLADLAVKHGMKFATFDQGIKHPAVELIS